MDSPDAITEWEYVFVPQEDAPLADLPHARTFITRGSLREYRQSDDNSWEWEYMEGAE
jgi:hypothetical protein